MSLRISAISDLHGLLPSIQPCDVLVIAGDICPVDNHSRRRQREFLDGPFRQWLNDVPASHVIGIAGNHDFIFTESSSAIPEGLRWTYLKDEGTQIEGVRFWGSPWSVEFGNWAFMKRDEKLAPVWQKIPTNTDVLIVHGPPFGVGDLNWQKTHTGSKTLANRLEELNVPLVVFGHIHEAHGFWEATSAHGGARLLANVCHVDLSYQPSEPEMRFAFERGVAKIIE